MNRLLFFFGTIFLLSANVAKAQPCNGAPASGTIFPGSSMTYCLSTQHLMWFYVAGYTQGGGITLQWESSPLGASQWTPIPGATTDTLGVGIISFSGGVLLRVAVTCSTMTSYTPFFTVPPPNGPNCQDSVWPGDVNYDLVVNNMDALDLATAYGSQGWTRFGASNAWMAQFSKDWWPTFSNSVNHKNADCNGDGIVNINDTLAIYNNYGLVHQKGYHHIPMAKTTTDPDLYFDFTGVNFVAGTTVTVPIKLGNATYPMNNILGLAASIKLDGVALTAPPTVTYNTSWLGTTANTLRFSKAVNNNQLDWAFARTDQQNISGNGTIAHVSFTLPPNSTGQGILYFDNVKVINSAGVAISGYNVIDDTLQVIPLGIANTMFEGGSVTVIPNPSASVAKVQFTLTDGQQVKLEVVDVAGKKVWEQSVSGQSGAQSVALPADIAPGVYMIKLTGSSSAASLKWMKN